MSTEVSPCCSLEVPTLPPVYQYFYQLTSPSSNITTPNCVVKWNPLLNLEYKGSRNLQELDFKLQDLKAISYCNFQIEEPTLCTIPTSTLCFYHDCFHMQETVNETSFRQSACKTMWQILIIFCYKKLIDSLTKLLK